MSEQLQTETKSRDELGRWESARYENMEYECEYCGKTRTFDGIAVNTRSPFGDDDDECTIHRMHLKEQEAYWNGEKEIAKVVSHV